MREFIESMTRPTACEVCGQDNGHKRWHWKEMAIARAERDCPPAPKMAADDPRRDEEPPF